MRGGLGEVRAVVEGSLVEDRLNPSWRRFGVEIGFSADVVAVDVCVARNPVEQGFFRVAWILGLCMQRRKQLLLP